MFQLPNKKLIKKFKKAMDYFNHVFCLIMGLPDYNQYLKNHKEYHPEKKPMSYKEFLHHWQKKHYSNQNRGRCC